VSAIAALIAAIFLVRTAWRNDTHPAFSSLAGTSSGASPSQPAKPAASGRAERDHGITAAEERDVYLKRLQSSDEATDGTQLASAQELVKQWRQITSSSGHRATIPAPSCFQTGCVVTTVFSPRSDCDELSETMARTPGFVGWVGPKWRSGPIARDGSYEATWILYVRNPAGQHSVPADGS
jgi:hypothetical protein